MARSTRRNGSGRVKTQRAFFLSEIVGAMILVGIAVLIPFLQPPRRVSLNHFQVQSLPWELWEENDSTIFTSDRPRLIKNSSAREWNAFRLWTPEYLSHNCKAPISGVKESSQSLFLFYEPDFPFQLSHSKFVHQLVSPMHMSELIGRIQNRSESQSFVYFSSELKRFCRGQFAHDMDPFDHLIARKGKGDWERNVWIGGKGVAANFHYDAQSNFYLQIYGKKRFILAPPESFYAMHVFPRMHSCDRQSQIIWEEFDSVKQLKRKYSEHLSTPLLVVDLEPGDLLYLPSFWFHRVESLSVVSISANVWSEGDEMIAVRELMDDALPYLAYVPEQDLTTAVSLSLLRTYFTSLTTALFPAPIQRDMFWRNLIQHQFSSIEMDLHEYRDMECYMDSEGSKFSRVVSQAVEHVVKLFGRIPVNRHAQVLGNVMEMSTLALIGEPRRAVKFIVHCMSQRSS